MEIRNARNVTLYNFKGEFNEPMLWIRDSDKIRLFGYGGNAAAYEGRELIRVERTPNFVCTNLVDLSRLPGSGVVGEGTFGGGVDPRRWHLLSDAPDGSEPRRLPPLERPVLYRRGTP